MAPRIWRLALIVIAIAATSCSGDLRDPTGQTPYDTSNGYTGGGGGGGGGGSSTLVGSWQTIFIFRLTNDVQTHTTTWSFQADGSCSRRVEVFSVLADRTLTTTVTCTWVTSGNDVAITFSGSPGPVSFRWSLMNFSPDELVLDGVTYDRIG
jgi:hypothetical protein